MRKKIVWQITVPVLGWLAFLIQHLQGWPWLNFLMLPLLIACTLQAVHHAEIIALKVGQPFGTLVLALAVTAIESSLILSVMNASGPAGSELARDTVFAAVMIILNGMIGVSLIAGSRKYHEQTFLTEGINALLITLVSVSVLTLVLPNFTISVPGPYYTQRQLFFVAIVTLILYGTFLFVQNLKHRHYFVTDDELKQVTTMPTRRQVVGSIFLLLICLGAVVAQAELLADPLNQLLDDHHLPRAIAGITIAGIILLPEGLSAYKAASNNQLQKSLNFSLGSALASIGLTIPIVSIYAIITDMPLSLGIDKKSTILLILSIFMVIMALRTGRTTILNGVVLFVIFLVYLFFSVVP